MVKCNAIIVYKAIFSMDLPVISAQTQYQTASDANQLSNAKDVSVAIKFKQASVSIQSAQSLTAIPAPPPITLSVLPANQAMKYQTELVP